MVKSLHNFHSEPFKNSNIKMRGKFENMKEFNDKQYNTRDINGNVITEPKNMKNGEISKKLFSSCNYILDPYER